MLICVNRLPSVRFWLNLFVPAALALLVSVPAHAQDAVGDGAGSISELVEQGDDLLQEKYEGIAREYGGYRKSPILFGKNSSGGNLHPDVSQFSLEDGLNPAALDRAGWFNSNTGAFGITPLSPPLDLSVDDEITKSAMAEFRTINANNAGQAGLHNEFLADEFARDEHLNAFGTARGIAVLTLSYLDKTVAAGLATVQQQADADTMQSLLKQMTHNIAKLANPEQARLYDDMDEKFDACMQGIGTNGSQTAQDVPGGPKATPVVFDAIVQCQINVPNSTYCGGPKRYGSSKYAFCTCCAESNSFANVSTTNPKAAPGFLYVEGFSLVDRIFLGLKVPVGRLRIDSTGDLATDTTYDGGAAMVEFAAMVRAMYGDILFAPKHGNPLSTGGQERTNFGEPGKLTIKFTSPLLSVQEWVKAFRDLYDVKKIYPYNTMLQFSRPGGGNADECHWELNEGMWLPYCSALGTSIVWGICPALNCLLDHEKDNTLTDLVNDTKTGYSDKNCPSDASKPDQAKWTMHDGILQLWAESSLGGDLLSRADLTFMAELRDTNEGKRIIEAYCDTSAVEALRRLHRKMMTLSNDMLSANRKATDNEKKQYYSLVQRIDDQLKAGAEDARSKDDDLLLALEMQKDRRRQAITSSMVATGNAAERRARRVGGLFQAFGGAFPR